MRDTAGLMMHHQATARNFAFSPKKPKVLTGAMRTGGERAKRAFEAMMPMKKIDVATIEKAVRG